MELLFVYHGINTSYEYLTYLVLFFTCNGSLGIDQLAVQNMVSLDHRIHRLGILESKKPKSTRFPGGTISHDSMVNNLSKFGKIFH